MDLTTTRNSPTRRPPSAVVEPLGVAMSGGITLFGLDVPVGGKAVSTSVGGTFNSLNLSGVTLVTSVASSGPVLVEAKVAGSTDDFIALCSLRTGGKAESYPLAVSFNRGSRVTFRARGDAGGGASVAITGHMSPRDSGRDAPSPAGEAEPPAPSKPAKKSAGRKRSLDERQNELKTSTSKKSRAAAPVGGSGAGSTKTFRRKGVECNDIVVGTGAIARRGCRLWVKYRGTHRGREFDSNMRRNAPPFRFRLGAGQVIDGWDIGVDGMRVGGRRRLVIPPKLAYGRQGAPPDIPPNATLKFEVELVRVK